jgi:hypothetical protein
MLYFNWISEGVLQIFLNFLNEFSDSKQHFIVGVLKIITIQFIHFQDNKEVYEKISIAS